MARKKKKDEFDLAFITPNQAAKISQEIDYLETMLKADQASRRPKIQDIGEVVQNIKKKKDILENHVPKKLRGQTSNKAFARAKELADKIKEELPTKKDYFMPYPKDESSSDFERAVRQQIRFQTDPKIQSMVREYKHLVARIDPSDPTIRDIERLRD